MINKINGWETLEESEVLGGLKVEAGVYPAQIKSVEDVPEKEYLLVKFDFVDGKYKDYCQENEKKFGEWARVGIYYASYKESASKFFKAFITAIQKSNQNYVWNWDEKSLVGKYAVLAIGDEEYLKDNEVKVSQKIREVRSIDAYKKGEIKVPELKKLKQAVSSDPFTDIANNLPF